MPKTYKIPDKKITRTIETTTAKCLVYSLTENKAEEIEKDVPFSTDDTGELEQYLRFRIDTQETRLIMVLATKKEETKYYCYQSEFLKIAKRCGKDDEELGE